MAEVTLHHKTEREKEKSRRERKGFLEETYGHGKKIPSFFCFLFLIQQEFLLVLDHSFIEKAGEVRFQVYLELARNKHIRYV